MPLLTPDINFGRQLISGAQGFRQVDNQTDHYENGVFSPFPWETGATERNQDVGYFLALNEYLTANTNSIAVRNNTGSTIGAVPVYVSGWDATHSKYEIKKADASVQTKSASFVLLSPLTTATNGTAVKGGAIASALDTSAATIDDPVYLASGGGYTLTNPQIAFPNYLSEIVGWVVTTALGGNIQVLIQSGAGGGSGSGTQGIQGPQGTTTTGPQGIQGSIGVQGFKGFQGLTGAMPNPSIIGCQNAGPQYPISTSMTNLPFGTENIKIGSDILHSTSVNADQFQVTATGTYIAQYQGWLENYFGYWQMQATKNGTLIPGSFTDSNQAYQDGGGNSAQPEIDCTFGFSANAGDIIRLQALSVFAPDALKGYKFTIFEAGSTGPQGIPGTNGTQGPQGIQGTNGVLGGQGFTGPQGFNGAPGGPQGFTGPQGSGPQGNTGAGFQGTQGPQGVQGNAGTQGPQGLGFQGFTGPIGATGTAGSMGPQGFIGVTGNQGPQGPVASGSFANISSSVSQTISTGSFTDLLFDTNDVISGVDISHSTSSNTNRILINQTGTYDITYEMFSEFLAPNHQIQAKVNGSTVIPGSLLDGSLSQANITAYLKTFGATLNAGDYFTIQGKSGTGTDTLQNISVTIALNAAGPMGSQGFGGPQGYQGPIGSTGTQGVQGTTGNTGSTGTQGVQGSQGYQGPIGNTGTQGVAGPQGFQGIAGAQGSTGSGFQGVQGAFGSNGVQGVSGVQGLTGSGTQGATGAKGVQGTGFTTLAVYKAVDESRASNTTVRDDNTLSLTLLAPHDYAFKACLFMDVPPSGGGIAIRIGGTLPSVFSIRYVELFYPGFSQQVSVYNITNYGVTIGGGTPAVSTLYCEITGGIQTSGITGGTLTVQWDQLGSSATANTMKANSSLIAWQIV